MHCELSHAQLQQFLGSLIIVSVNTNLTSSIFCHSVISSHTTCSFDISALCVSSDNKPNSSISFISACFQFLRMFFVICFQLILVVVSLLFFGIFLLVSCSLPLGFHSSNVPTYSFISEDKEFTVFGLGGFLLHYMHTMCYEN